MKIKLSLFFCIVTTFICIGCNYVSDSSPEEPLPLSEPELEPDPSIQYTVHYNNQSHGSNPESKTVPLRYKLTSEDLQPLSEDGWIFLGWFIGEDRAAVNTSVTSDMTITAKWKFFSPPLRVFARCTDSGVVTVTWINPPSEDFDTVEVKMNNGEPTVFTNTDSDNTRKVYTGLSTGTEYSFEVKTKKGTLEKAVVVKAIPYNGTQLSQTGTNGSMSGYTDQT